MDAADDRERLRQTFDTVAARYHAARPGYPGALYDTLISLARLAPDQDEILEIGCGTGKATIQDVYDEIGADWFVPTGSKGLPPGSDFAKPDTLADRTAEIAATGLFTDVTIRRFDWEIAYTADSYLRLLDTFSGHIAMAPWQRERLYGEIRRRLGQRPGGRVRRHWGAVLHVARAQ